MKTCKECKYWNKLQSSANEGICLNRCGKVMIHDNKTGKVVNENSTILTKINFGCVSFVERI